MLSHFLILSLLIKISKCDICDNKIQAIMNSHHLVKMRGEIIFVDYKNNMPFKDLNQELMSDMRKQWIQLTGITAMYSTPSHDQGYLSDARGIRCEVKDVPCAFKDIASEISKVEAATYSSEINIVLGVISKPHFPYRQLVAYDFKYGRSKILQNINSTEAYPTAMTTFKGNLYVIWEREDSNKQFYQIIPPGEEFPAMYDLSKHDMRPATHWKGCPQDMCLEGNIDWILNDNGKILISRENHIFELSQLGSGILKYVRNVFIKIKNLENKFGQVQTAYADNEIFYITDEYVTLNNAIRRTAIFKNLNQGRISATTFNPYDKTITLFHENGQYYQYYDYTFIKFGAWKKNEIQESDFLIPWTHLDAAYFDPVTNLTYFFNSDYYITYDTINPTKKVEQRFNFALWECSQDNFDKSDLAKWFNVKSFPEYWFQVYKFRAPAIWDQTSPSTVTYSPMASSPNDLSTISPPSSVTKSDMDSPTLENVEAEDKMKVGLLIGIIVGVILVVIIIILIIYFLCKRKMKKRKSSRNYVDLARYKSGDKSHFETTLHTTVNSPNKSINTNSFSGR